MYRPGLCNRPAQQPSINEPKSSGTSDESGALSYEILFRKKSSKKHKVWEGDGVAVPKNDNYLIKVDRKVIATVPAEKLHAGTEIISHGSYEFELGAKLSAKYQPEGSLVVENSRKKKKKSVSASATHLPDSSPGPSSSAGTSLEALLSGKMAKPAPLLVKREVNEVKDYAGSPGKTKRPALREDGAAVAHDKELKVEPKAKRVTKTLGSAASKPLPAHQSKPGSPQPKILETAGFTKKPQHHKSTTESPKHTGWRIDPKLVDKLRPHQTEAVEFLYQCISGNRHCYGRGALLADDMGLGKTLTSIALIYSLLQAEMVETVLVACPATLIKNWKAEFRKWLPNSINVFACLPGEDVKSFCKSGLRRTYPVMIAGYERIRSVASQVKEDMGTFDLVVCDEGHRLKSADSKTLSGLEEISGDRRIILSGTPVQNNLGEFWTMAEFLNPGVFGSKLSKFTRKYSDPIRAAREQDADELVKEIGQEKMKELIEITNEFVLRRDQTVLAGHVTVPKTEYLVFCKPTQHQILAYQQELGANHFWDNNEALPLITKLRKISTSARLLKKPSGSFANQLESMDPLGSSSKMMVLKSLLQKLHETTKEKVVIVSGYTETLDLVQQVCGMFNMSWVRLDGSTPQAKRQSMVDMFNSTPKERVFAFILSAKSGGVGLNLIGASRLVMVDCDWNPSVDLQAMARIHRDGQKKPVYIYRLVSTGMIDEKILQRQITKQGVSDSLFEMDDSGDKFTREQLKEIFSFKTCVKSDTLEQGLALEYTESDGDPILSETATSTGLISCILSRV